MFNNTHELNDYDHTLNCCTEWIWFKRHLRSDEDSVLFNDKKYKPNDATIPNTSTQTTSFTSEAQAKEEINTIGNLWNRHTEQPAKQQ